MKRTAIGILALCVIVVEIFLIDHLISYLPKERTQVPGTYGEGTVTDIFLINDVVCYVSDEGEFYALDDFGKKTLVKTFPTYSVYWNDTYQVLVFLDGNGNIVGYDPILEKEKFNINVADKKTSISNAEYVICMWKKYVYCKIGGEIYKIDLSDGEISFASPKIQYLVAVSKEGIVCLSDDHQSIIFIDPLTDEQQILLVEEANAPIIAACVMDDLLFYACADGIIRHCNMNEDTDEVYYQKMIETLSGERIVGLAESGENLLCIVARPTGDVIMTEVCLVLPDGTKDILRSANKPYYSVPGSCIVRANEKVFAFGITTDRIVVSDLIVQKGEIRK